MASVERTARRTAGLPYQMIQSGPAYSQSLLDLPLFRSYQIAREGVRETLAEENVTREDVVAAVVAQYLLVLRAFSIYDAAQARVALAERLYEQAVSLQKTGIGLKDRRHARASRVAERAPEPDRRGDSNPHRGLHSGRTTPRTNPRHSYVVKRFCGICLGGHAVQRWEASTDRHDDATRTAPPSFLVSNKLRICRRASAGRFLEISLAPTRRTRAERKFGEWKCAETSSEDAPAFSAVSVTEGKVSKARHSVGVRTR